MIRRDVDPKTGDERIYDPPLRRYAKALVVVRDDGVAFSESPIDQTFPLEKLDIPLRLPEPVPDSRAWSGPGVVRYLEGGWPEPDDVFRRVVSSVDRFMDFNRSLAPQETMCELVASYILGTYLLDGFLVVGYLWPSGDRGAGKTHFLVTVCELAYLGQVILSGGSYATLRDFANYGACIGFDDVEGIMDLKRADPDKRALLLAGNRKGTTVSLKEQQGKRWVTRHIHAFCPRMFSAIRLPDPVLASRTILVPLVRSSDKKKTDLDPLDPDC